MEQHRRRLSHSGSCPHRLALRPLPPLPLCRLVVFVPLWFDSCEGQQINRCGVVLTIKREALLQRGRNRRSHVNYFIDAGNKALDLPLDHFHP